MEIAKVGTRSAKQRKQALLIQPALAHLADTGVWARLLGAGGGRGWLSLGPCCRAERQAAQGPVGSTSGSISRQAILGEPLSQWYLCPVGCALASGLGQGPRALPLLAAGDGGRWGCYWAGQEMGGHVWGRGFGP